MAGLPCHSECCSGQHRPHLLPWTARQVSPTIRLILLANAPGRATDVDPAVDNDEANLNDWTNWCGPRVSNPSSEYLFGSNREMLTSAFALCQDQSEETEAKIARIQQNGESPGSAAYVFQLLDSRTTEILFTWPPTKPTGKGYDSLLYGGGEQGSEQERYSAEEYATLAKSVIEKPRANVPAETNCTKRFQSTHPM